MNETSYLDIVKAEWEQAIAPLWESHNGLNQQLKEIQDMAESSPKAVVRLAVRSKIAEIQTVIDENEEILSRYQSIIDNATEEDMVSEDLDLMTEELTRLHELAKQNQEYFKNQEVSFM